MPHHHHPLLSSMTPLERWRHSPQESGHVSESAIQQALNTGASRGAAPGDLASAAAAATRPNGYPARAEGLGPTTTEPAGEGGGAGGGAAGAGGDPMMGGGTQAANNSSGNNNSYQYSSDGSNSSSYSQLSGHSDPCWSARSPDDGPQGTWTKASASARARQAAAKARMFTCGYCSRTFSKKYDWLRHERSLHAPGDVSWICSVPLQPSQSFLLWRLGHDQPECIFCGHVAPTEEHFHSHEFEACSKRAVQDRSFSRKDHMWQHLYKFHGCRKWDGWKPDLNLLQHKA
ncbi:hypothetical protein CDD83_2517 [Cordyceps sp. RAO-2017]|nr:hypothetical protein CDD83_2517 [Cordyceps sp. RAO-2017]